MRTGMINSNPSKMEEKLNGVEAIEEALGKLDNEQDVQEVLNFIVKKINDRKNFRRIIHLANEMKNCAKELSKIAPNLTFCVTDCYANRGAQIDFQELYEALDEISIN